MLKRVKEKNPFNLNEVKLIMNTIMNALDFLHNKDIAHCDIKPCKFII